MVKLNYAHLCDYAFILGNGTPAIIGIFSEIKASSLPIIRTTTSIAINLFVDDEDVHSLDVSIISPSGKPVISPFKQSIQKKGNSLGIGSMINIGSLRLEEEGIYKISIEVDEKLLKTLLFSITIIK